jgi:RimJ/RimL family protein N-acetyltransferase
MSDTVLETERLTLREYRLDDIDAAAEMFGDPVHMRYYPHPFSRQESLEWIERNLTRYEDDGFGLWVVEPRDTGEFIGNVGLTIQVVDDVEEVEVGWHITPSLWGHGYAPEAAAACRDYAFAELGMQRLIAITGVDNLPSQRVAEKIGMHVEKQSLFKGLYPSIIYAIEAPL